MSRGIAEKQAEALLIQAFVGETVETIANEQLRELAMLRAIAWLEARGWPCILPVNLFRSFPRKRESRAKNWVPAFAGTSGGLG